jgi:hypothetical protein
LLSRVILSVAVLQVTSLLPALGPDGDADPEVPADWEPLALADGGPAAPVVLLLEWQAVASAVTVAARTIGRPSERFVRIDTGITCLS